MHEWKMGLSSEALERAGLVQREQEKSCGVGHRCGLDPVLLWLWCRQATAAPIRPLAWERPYATGVALKSKT